MMIIPIKELKDGAKISAKCHELDEPIHITKNGYGDMVIMSTETFERYDQALKQAAARELARQNELAETVAHVRSGLADIADGRTRDAFESLAEMRARHDV